MERKPFISQRHRGGAHYQPRRAFAGAVAGGRDARTPRTEGSAGRGRPAPRRPPACSQPASQPAAAPERADVETLWAACWGYARALPPPYFPRQWTSALSLARNAPPQRPDAPSGTPSPSRRPRAAAPPPAGWAPPPPPGRPGRLRPRSGPPGRARGRRRRAAPGHTHAPPRSRWRFVFKLRLAPPARNYSPQDALRPPGRLSMRGRASVRGVRGWPRRCVRPPLGLERCCGSVWAPC